MVLGSFKAREFYTRRAVVEVLTGYRVKARPREE